MLFNGWSVATYDPSWANPWPRNPFHRENNVNDINGDPDGNGMGQKIHSLAIPGVTKLEDAYAKRTSRWRAAAGGLASRVTNGTDWLGASTVALGLKVQR